MLIPKIGEIVTTYHNEKYQCVVAIDPKCTIECDFKKNCLCVPFDICCDGKLRPDHTDVVFKKINPETIKTECKQGLLFS